MVSLWFVRGGRNSGVCDVNVVCCGLSEVVGALVSAMLIWFVVVYSEAVGALVSVMLIWFAMVCQRW